MRFITEFELPKPDGPEDRDYKNHMIKHQKALRERDMGALLSDSFGWQNPVYGNENRYRLEIEAFPMDKWIEFEKRFYDALPDYDIVSKTRLINALTALMTFTGKPSGDTITNPK